MENKHDWRYLPKTVMVRHAGGFGVRPIVRYVAYAPHMAPRESTVRRDMVTVQAITDLGACAWWGFTDAKVNSELRMIAYGGCINPKNELTRMWEKCKEE